MLWLWGVFEDGPRIESGVTGWGRGDLGVKVSASKDSKIQIENWGQIPFFLSLRAKRGNPWIASFLAMTGSWKSDNHRDRGCIERIPIMFLDRKQSFFNWKHFVRL